MRIKKFMVAAALTTSLVMSTMTVSAAPQSSQTQGEMQYTTEASESELAAIKKLFNAKEYAAMYPDVAVVYGDNEEALWSHFVNFGLAEGRTLRKDFNVFAYRSAYKDLQEAFGNDLAAYYAHYANNGMEEGRPLTTIEKVTKAGIAVTGLRGQILAEAVPAPQPTTAIASTSGSASAGNSEASTPSQGSSGDSSSKPSENPSPAPNPEPSTPDPGPEPSGPSTCAHDGGIRYESDATGHKEVCKKCGTTMKETVPHQWNYIHAEGDNTHIPVCAVCDYQGEKAACESEKTVSNTTGHWNVCKVCNGKFNQESHKWNDGTCSVCGAACSHESWRDGVCENCGKKCSHEFCDGMRQIEGTTEHAPICTICDGLDLAGKESCVADHCDSVDDSVHHEICKACGGVIKEEPHQYTYTNETAEDGTPIHKGTCPTCGNQMERACEFDKGSDTCKICKYQHTTHDWDPATGACKFCGVTCKHTWGSNDSKIHKCTTCGKESPHYFRWVLEFIDANSHKVQCSACKYIEISAHEFQADGYCSVCTYNADGNHK